MKLLTRDRARACIPASPNHPARRCGCTIAVGVDGPALDEDGDVIRELLAQPPMAARLRAHWAPNSWPRHPQRPRRPRPRPRRTRARRRRFRHPPPRPLRPRRHHGSRPAAALVHARQRLAGARRRGRRPDHSAGGKGGRCRFARDRAGTAGDVPRGGAAVRWAGTGLGTVGGALGRSLLFN